MSKIRVVLMLFLIMASGGRVCAQTGEAPTAKVKIIAGPATITLGDRQGNLKLPSGFNFVGKTDAEQALKGSGEPVPEGVLGLVSDEDPKLDWFALLRYNDCGYIRDDEADHLNADSLLETIKEGTKRDNEERRQHGGKGMEVVGWYKPPVYNHGSHTLSWSIIGQGEGDSSQTVNFSLMMLGRYGLMSSTVVGDMKDAPALQARLDQLAVDINFPSERDYGSWRSGDRVAEVTMTGLITGGAAAAAYGAAKVGIFAKLGKMILLVVLALKKAIIVVIAGIGAAFRWIGSKLSGRSGKSGGNAT